jgi:hypothetical protein
MAGASVALWNGWLCAKAGFAKRHRGDYRAIHSIEKIKYNLTFKKAAMNFTRTHNGRNQCYGISKRPKI